MTTTDHLTVRFEYSAAVHADAWLDEPERRAIFKWWKPANLAVMAIMFGRLWLKGTFTSMSAMISTLLVMAPFMAFMLFVPEFLKNRVRARFRREAALRGDPFETQTFGPEGFRARLDWPQPIPWSQITKVAESKRFFFIYNSTSSNPEYVPKAAMSTTDVGRLRALFQDKLRKGHAELRLFPGAQTPAPSQIEG